MVQVFSKGKVSAEELSGQLGERLPGAVTLFAKANKMTLPELQKNLKAGTVGLNELMTFIRQLGEEFDGTAKDIASSNEEAGARLTVAFDNMKLGVGNALKDIGAEFQNVFGRFIEEIAPSAIKLAEALAKALVPVAKNLDLILVSVAGLAAGAALGAAVKGFVALKTAILAAYAAGNLLMLSPIFGGALAVAGIVAGIYAITKAFRAQRTEVEQLAAASRNIPIAQLSNKDRGIQIAESKRILTSLRAKRGRLIAAGESEGGFDTTDIDAQIAAEEKRLGRLTAPIAKKTAEEFKYKPITPDGAGAGSGIKDISDKQLAKALAELNARQKIAALDKESIELKRAQFVAQRDTAIAAAKAANAAKGGLEPNRETLAIGKANATFAAQNLRLDQQIERQAEKNLQSKQKEEELILRGRLMAGEITQEQFDQKQQLQGIQDLLELQPELYEKIKKKLEEAATPLGKFRDGVRKIFEEAMNLNQALAERGVQAVQQFGDAFADFVATGKANFADLTRSILQDLSRIFARAALFKGLSLIPGVGNFLGLGGGGGGGASAQSPDPMFNNFLIAGKGAAFAKNNIVPYAMGGIVNKPTLFQYANGGSGRFGLMGEAGPEAIMPLRRGRGGKLGVEASGGVGNVVVNVDASGSRVQGDQPNAKALGSAIGAAVQAEIVRQKRPGGLLS